MAICPDHSSICGWGTTMVQHEDKPCIPMLQMHTHAPFTPWRPKQTHVVTSSNRTFRKYLLYIGLFLGTKVLRSYTAYLGRGPPASNSHHQNYCIFGRVSRARPAFPTGREPFKCLSTSNFCCVQSMKALGSSSKVNTGTLCSQNSDDQ